MAVTIDASLSWPAHRNQFVGPVEDGNGNLYVALYDTTEGVIEMWKSTDGGDTWVEQDNGGTNQPGYGGGTPHVCDITIDAALNTIYVLRSSHTYPSFAPDVASFNTSSAASSQDTWTSAEIGNIGLNSDGVHVSGTSAQFVVVRSDGDLVVAYQGIQEMIMGASFRRLNVQVWNGSTWPSLGWNTPGIEAHQDLRAVVLGANDRTHVFFTRTDSDHVQHRSIDSDNTSNSAEDLTGITDIDETRLYAFGLGTLNGSEIVQPYVEPFSADTRFLRATSAATIAGTATSTDLSNFDPEDFTSNPGAAVNVDGTIYWIQVDDIDLDIDYWNDQGIDTWSGPTSLESGVTVAGLSASHCPGNGIIGVVFNDNGTVKFSTIDVGGGEEPATAIRDTIGTGIIPSPR